MLNLIVENQAEIPVFMQAANGNQSDQTACRSIISSHVVLYIVMLLYRN